MIISTIIITYIVIRHYIVPSAIRLIRVARFENVLRNITRCYLNHFLNLRNTDFFKR